LQKNKHNARTFNLENFELQKFFRTQLIPPTTRHGYEAPVPVRHNDSIVAIGVHDRKCATRINSFAQAEVQRETCGQESTPARIHSGKKIHSSGNLLHTNARHINVLHEHRCCRL
jgi:hypothetical protein